MKIDFPNLLKKKETRQRTFTAQKSFSQSEQLKRLTFFFSPSAVDVFTLENI